MLTDEAGRTMCCVDCGDPAQVEDEVDSWLEDGEIVTLVEYLCLGDKIRRQQDRRRKTENPVV